MLLLMIMVAKDGKHTEEGGKQAIIYIGLRWQ